jgi:muconolactone D-isomerase
MLYFLDFHVEYPSTMSQKDLFQIWAREADAAIGAKQAGAEHGQHVHVDVVPLRRYEDFAADVKKRL